MKIFRGRVKILKAEITCEHCVTFNGSGRTDKEGNRKCGTQFIDKHTPACDDFELHPYFYCKRDNARLDIIVCLSRMNKKREGCIHCQKGKQIQRIAKTIGG